MGSRFRGNDDGVASMSATYLATEWLMGDNRSTLVTDRLNAALFPLRLAV